MKNELLIGLVTLFIIGCFLLGLSMIAYKCQTEVKYIELQIEQVRND